MIISFSTAAPPVSSILTDRHQKTCLRLLCAHSTTIFTGGPDNVFKEESLRCPKELFELGIPILGICYGAQLMAYMLGGNVATSGWNCVA